MEFIDVKRFSAYVRVIYHSKCITPVVDDVGAVMYVCSYMTKGEKAMGETLKRVSKECKNDDICTQMKKNQERISRQKGVWNTRVCNANPINVADEEE